MKRILAISLLLIFIAGQVNLTWATHFCGKFAVQSSVSLGIDDLTCGMEEEFCCDEDDNEIDGPIIISEECCSNDYYSSNADDYFNKVESFTSQEVDFPIAYVLSFFDLTFEIDEQNIFIASSPPLIQSDQQVLYQSFLL